MVVIVPAVMTAGDIWDGNGNLWAVLLGDVLGSSALVGAALATQGNLGAIALGLLAPLAGTILGYELSSAASRQDAERQERDRQALARATGHRVVVRLNGIAF
jgi:hypothetical protein